MLALIAEGLSNRQIADRLVMSVNPVKTPAHNLNARLDTANRTQAVARARELGLLGDYFVPTNLQPNSNQCSPESRGWLVHYRVSS